jgi:hypothetical protein
VFQLVGEDGDAGGMDMYKSMDDVLLCKLSLNVLLQQIHQRSFIKD